MSEDTRTEIDAIAARVQAPVMTEVHQAPHCLTPPGWNIADLSRHLPQPLRIKESPVFTGASDFAAYFHEFKAEGARIFVDDKKYRFTTVFDCSTPGVPRHGDHSASLQMDFSPEWTKWKAKNAHAMTSREFSAFIENNIENIGDDEFPAIKLLDMCRRLRVAFKGDVSVDEIDADGVRTLTANAAATVRGATPDGVAIPFPEYMAVNLRIFRNAARYTFKARLRWDCDAGKTSFRFDLQNVEAVEEAAFDEVIEAVKRLTERPVLRGAYAGTYHK